MSWRKVQHLETPSQNSQTTVETVETAEAVRFPADLQLILVPLIVPDMTATRKFFNAAVAGNKETLELFLHKPIDPDIVFQGQTALHIATAHSHYQLVRLLLEAGADKDKVSEDLRSWVPLNFGRGDSSMLRLLLDAAANPNGTTTAPLIQAVDSCNVETVKMLLDAGANLELPKSSPLLLAAKRGNSEVVRLLIEARARPDVTAGAGESPLVAAAHKGRTAVVRLLLDFGADKDQMANVSPYTPFPRPRTALSVASEAGQVDVVRILLSVGASKDGVLRYSLGGSTA